MSAPDLDALVSPEDWERAAQPALDPTAHAYFAGGATDEITLADNRAAWSRLAVRPRALVGVGRGDSSIEPLGRRRPHPVLIAPTAYQRLAHPEGECDTARAAAAGVSGLIVSNHGGRQLDTVLAGADALPAIADEVGDEIDVLVDSGIRRGTDIVKALALGARAVCIGRPVVYGLAVAGAAGGQRVIETLLGELDNALGLSGRPVAAELDRSFVTRALWAAR